MYFGCDLSGFLCGVVEAVAILENYASHVDGLPTFRDGELVTYSSVLDCLTIEDETDRLSQKVCKKLPMHAA